MRQTLLLFFTLVVGTMGFGDFVNQIGQSLNMTREQLMSCVNKTGVTQEDVMHIDEIIQDSLQTIDFDNRALRVGCMLTCIAQNEQFMIGAAINLNRIKERWRAKAKGGKSDIHAKVFQILHTCNNRVKSKIDACE